MLPREGHVGQHIGLGLIEDGGEFGHLWPDLVGDGTPLQAGGLWRLLGKGGGDEGGDDTAAALAGMGQDVTHEVYAGAVEEVRGLSTSEQNQASGAE